ncbi:MAG: aminotransferase class V-fold PLP-dependent enzyme [Planctomycetaceae bacterium]
MMSSDEFRRYGREVIDWIADYMDRVESLPVQSGMVPGALRAALPDTAPQQGEPFSDLMADVDRLILPGITHWQSPNFFGYFPANTSPPSILGELLTAGLGVQGMLWATSPACTELEQHVLDWLVDMLDLPDGFRSTGTGGGVIQDSASSAALCALLAACYRQGNSSERTTGIDRRLVAYASIESHSSIEKAAVICGMGTDRLRLIDTDSRFRMHADRLEDQMQTDLRNGLIPVYVCATVGTTSTGAIDPVDQIGRVCRKYGAWLHVDAAMAGTAALCPELRAIHDGLQSVDSYAFNPHKWMCVNFDCNCFFVADRQPLLRALSILPDYLQNQASQSGQVTDYRDWQIPLGRRFRALKLWFVIRSFGISGLQQLVRDHVALAREFAGWVQDSDDFELAAPQTLNLICFRHKGDDASNRSLLDRLNASGRLFLTHTRVNNRMILRLSIGQAQTRREHVLSAWQDILKCSRDLT